MPSDRVLEKITNYAEMFGGGNVEKWVDHAENTPNYAESSTINKIGNKAFQMYWTTVKRKAC